MITFPVALSKTVLLILFLLGAGAAGAQTKTAFPPTQITVSPGKVLHPIHSDFWGTNFLYWVDDDAALAGGQIAGHLKEANMRILRYPGGTVADNFHWQTNTLENVNMFPYESGAAESDFDEFMQVCRQVGAQPACVLNTETWAVKKDFSGGAHEAANWLRYCRKKGYQVKYWEIGNETYWHPVMSAADYADLVNVYADSLKRIDPNIVLGVNGHWDVNFVGTRERVKPEAIGPLMEMRRHISSRQTYEQYKDYLKANTLMPITKGEKKWWETVARKCGSKVDMIIVHWYFAPNQLPLVTGKLQEVRNLFAKMHPGKKYLLNLSEYNVTVRTPASHMHLTEMLGAMLQGKTDITGLWPMRMKYKKPTLLDVTSHQPSMLYQIHRHLSRHLTGALVESAAPQAIPAFAAASKTGSTVVMTGSKIDKPTSVSIRLQGQTRKTASCAVWRISGEEFNYQVKQEKVPVKNGAATVHLAPGEVVVSVFE
ncbi:MAG: hypothetical protein ACO1O1_13755 [Adhaeribacter sp.]